MANQPSNWFDPWIGKRLGDQDRYRLDQRLGNGGAGDVYLAMDTRLGRRVAIKLLKSVLAKSKEILARFEREVALSAALESEHIVQVIDYGVTDAGHPFYVMEHLKGQTLSHLMARSGRLSIERTVKIATQICAGLQIAHEGVTLWRDQATVSEQVKVIHRDLKPANVFLVPTALGELVKVLDFGIAKKLHTTQSAQQTNLTQAFLGTFRYAAPEQLRNAWKLDERADIYSLGLILYEMLSGTNPFGIDSAAKQQAEVSWAMAHNTVPPTPLRQQPGCDQLPIELEAIVMRCLCKAASDRFASVADLSRALNAVVAAQAHAVVGSQEATVVRPLVPDATVHRPVAAMPAPIEATYPVSFDPTTVPPAMTGWVAPAADRPEATIAQVASQPDLKPDATIVQPRQVSPPAVKSDATILQDRQAAQPGADQPSRPVNRDATIVQPRAAHRDATIAQPLRVSSETIVQPGRQSAVDRTIVQAARPVGAEATIAQPAHTPRPMGSDVTIAQPAAHAARPVGSDVTIAQPASSSPQNKRGLARFQPERAGFLTPIPAEIRSNPLAQRLIDVAVRRPLANSVLPIASGFLAGLALMGGILFWVRSHTSTSVGPSIQPPSLPKSK